MNPRARKRSVLILAVLILAAASFILLLRQNALSEKQIEGRPFAAWVRDLGRPSAREDAHAVLVRQGPAAIPILLDAIKGTRGLSARIEDRLPRIAGIKSLTGERVYWEVARSDLFRVISDIGFQHQFSTNAELHLAVAALIGELNSSSLSNRDRSAIIMHLGQFGPIATPALPAISKVMREGYCDWKILYALGNIGSREYWPEILAAATNRLSSRDERSQMAAIRVLGTIGTNAAVAVPHLVALIEQTSPEGATPATNLSHEVVAESVLIALAQIGRVPPHLKWHLTEMMDSGSRLSGAAAAAMLRIDPTEPTALAIVQSRLHPLVDRATHKHMVGIVCANPFIARLMEPQLTKLASQTNLATAQQARFTLNQMKAGDPRSPDH
jgi:hypothetical protein